MTYLTMLDDANVAQFYGTNTDAYAGYSDGYITFPWLLNHYADKYLMSISIHGNDADCLDMENGAASFGSFASWHARAEGRKLRTTKPVAYCAASNSSIVNSQGVPRSSYWLWSAHVGRGPHVCGPNVCGYPQADATQWTFTALGRSLDESLVSSTIFGSPSPVPVHPTIRKGDTGPAVTELQGDLKARGWAIVVDGIFGPVTEADVKQFQKKHRLFVDGIVGNLTWAALAKK